MIVDKEKEKKDYSKIGATIGKVIIGISVCITAGVVFGTCGVSASDIQECKKACGMRGMVSVSQWTCQCGWTSTSNNYVLPTYKKSK